VAVVTGEDKRAHCRQIGQYVFQAIAKQNRLWVKLGAKASDDSSLGCSGRDFGLMRAAAVSATSVGSAPDQ